MNPTDVQSTMIPCLAETPAREYGAGLLKGDARIIMEYPIGAIHKSGPTDHMHPNRVTCGMNRIWSVSHIHFMG